MKWSTNGSGGNGAGGASSSGSDGSFLITESDQFPENVAETERNIRGRSVSTATVEWQRSRFKKHSIGGRNKNMDENDETKSQQLILRPFGGEQLGFLRRTFSFQIGKTKEPFKLDPEVSAMIKIRYKDTSKYVIWPECPLPEEYNQGYLTLNSDRSKRTAIRYNHAGNHQAAILRLKNDDAVEKKELAIIPFGSPKTFPRTKSPKNQPQYIIYPSRTLATTRNLTTVEEEQRKPRTVSLNTETAMTTDGDDDVDGGDAAMVDIEDDRTPLPKRVINSVRRSESSDEDEPIVRLTAHRIPDESGFVDGDDAATAATAENTSSSEPDLQIWRL